jgi:NAD+ synthase (glutamine-hydrolysing)
MLYYSAAILQAQGQPSLVVGTTNRDEGAYIGFFGKASDAMVDLQPISDLHKSEVYALAEKLGVPKSVQEAIPSGDLYSGQLDEELIGAPYWFLELYLRLLEEGMSLSLNPVEQCLFERYQANIERLHRQNLHKYKVGSPAIHLDVLPRRILGGWQ